VGLEAQGHSIISELYTEEWPALHPGSFSPGERTFGTHLIRR